MLNECSIVRIVSLGLFKTIPPYGGMIIMYLTYMYVDRDLDEVEEVLEGVANMDDTFIYVSRPFTGKNKAVLRQIVIKSKDKDQAICRGRWFLKKVSGVFAYKVEKQQ